MTDSKTSIKATVDAENATDGVSATTATRRSALGFSMAGGLAALLSACGKYVTKFDKTGLATIVKGGEPEPGEGPGEGNAGAVTPTPTPTTTTPPEPPKPPSKFCFETSKATPVTDADFFVAGAKALYGNKFSSLLAVKAQKGKAWSPAIGDLVHILLKKNASESYLAASRRVRSTDDYSDGVGLVFESLYLDTFAAIQVVVIKGDKQYIAELPVTYSISHNGKPVFDLSAARTDLTKSNQVFGLGFGDSGAPNMAGTSNIGNPYQISSKPLLYDGGTYLAAKANSTWDLSNLIPAGTELKNIFGQSMSSSNTLLHEHQSLVVYRAKAGTVGGQALDGYLRYFIYVG